jgi:hypothetical protein
MIFSNPESESESNPKFSNKSKEWQPPNPANREQSVCCLRFDVQEYHESKLLTFHPRPHFVRNGILEFWSSNDFKGLTFKENLFCELGYAYIHTIRHRINKNSQKNGGSFNPAIFGVKVR